MIHQLSQGNCSIQVSSLGAELRSFFNRETGIEYIWQRDPAFWSKSSPILFPIVGGLKNGQYRYNGQVYHLPRHGFARERSFLLTGQSANSLCFSLVSDEETLAHYPFAFQLTIRYTLQHNQLQVGYTVSNTGTATQYFSIGAHPAFRVPMKSTDLFEDYFLAWDQPETIGRWPLSADGLIESKPLPLLNHEKTLPLTKQLFHQDALVFKNMASRKIAIRSIKHNYGVEMHFEGFPYYGIWSARDADFVCLEPWCGIADSVDTDGELTHKEGIHHLDPDAQFTVSWQVRVF
ncbi:MAG TPA: aldose 1-epimerase family protein [Sediminibacterium sp.]|nr:aldose 1-epimerase family protein [Sediminibacterium sp.]